MNHRIAYCLKFYLKEQRKQNIEKILREKNLIIGILGYGLTGKSFLAWALKNLHYSTRYFVIDKKHQIISKCLENKRVLFVPEINKNMYFKLCHFILPSPGIVIKKNERWYYKIISELDLFFYLGKNFNLETILVTGSIGKTSVVTILNHYMSKIYHTVLCGNIGYPVLAFLDNTVLYSNDNKKIVLIIEASNLQLEHSILVEPTYFIMTNLFQNHLDMHVSYKNYMKSKMTPILFCYKGIKKIIMSIHVYTQVLLYFPELLIIIKEKIILILDDVLELQHIKINIENYVYFDLHVDSIFYKNVLLVSKIPKISFILNWQILATIFYEYGLNIMQFIDNDNAPILPNFRLQKIIDSPGITIYNDSKSTIIESSLSALSQVKTLYNQASQIIFFIGGLSKGVDRIAGIKKILNQIDILILFGIESENLMHNLLMHNEKNKKIKSFLYLKDAIRYSADKYKLSNHNHTLMIFSPGGSSFDEFESYVDRGNQFNIMIKNEFK